MFGNRSMDWREGGCNRHAGAGKGYNPMLEAGAGGGSQPITMLESGGRTLQFVTMLEWREGGTTR